MKLHVCGGIFKFAVTFFHALKINTDIFQRRGKRDSIFVSEHARLIHVKRTRACSGPKQTFSKARALFVSPIHQANSDGRLTVELRVDTPKNFQPRKHIQAAVKPTAVGNGIHVTANEKFLGGFAAQCAPQISSGVGVGFYR